MRSDTRNIKVSVILPVYNVEGYIERCIESLQAQEKVVNEIGGTSYLRDRH